MVVVGITGGIGSGKGLATEFFRSRGAVILDADQIARELAQPGSQMLAQLAAAFGGEALSADGSLNRKRLAELVFGRPEAVAKLNAITHPPIVAEVKRRLGSMRTKGKVALACVVAPLLLEAGGKDLVDRLLVVTADEGERVARVRERDGLSEEEVRLRMAAQMPVEEQVRQADWVLDTTGSREQAIEQLERIWSEVAGQKREGG
jgi:dephospho-CoA kinase